MVFSNILVAVDGSRESGKAVDVATDLALKLEAKIVFLHVVNVPDVGQVSVASGNIEKNLRVALTETGKRVLEKAMEVARRKGISAAEKISEGNPAMTIVKEASRLGSDLIVMGSRGTTGIRRVVIGSTAEKVIRWSTVPVLVAKE